MTNEDILIEKKKEVAIMKLNRPERLNILNTPMLTSIGTAVERLRGDREVKAVIITGTGAFSAGADIREMKDMTPERAAAYSRTAHQVFSAVESLGKPVMAVVSGYALGGGCELALACDLRMAAESARLGQPEINLGIISGFGATQRLPRIVGPAKAKELLMTGRILDSAEALAIGLINFRVPDADLMQAAESIAFSLAAKSRPAMKIAKDILNETMRVDEGLAMETMAFSECFAFDDAREGMRAFLEKRPPRFES